MNLNFKKLKKEWLFKWMALNKPRRNSEMPHECWNVCHNSLNMCIICKCFLYAVAVTKEITQSPAFHELMNSSIPIDLLGGWLITPLEGFKQGATVNCLALRKVVQGAEFPKKKKLLLSSSRFWSLFIVLPFSSEPLHCP